jgi:hypothetical protein
MLYYASPKNKAYLHSFSYFAALSQTKKQFCATCLNS